MMENNNYNQNRPVRPNPNMQNNRSRPVRPNPNSNNNVRQNRPVRPSPNVNQRQQYNINQRPNQTSEHNRRYETQRMVDDNPYNQYLKAQGNNRYRDEQYSQGVTDFTEYDEFGNPILDKRSSGSTQGYHYTPSVSGYDEGFDNFGDTDNQEYYGENQYDKPINNRNNRQYQTQRDSYNSGEYDKPSYNGRNKSDESIRSDREPRSNPILSIVGVLLGTSALLLALYQIASIIMTYIETKRYEDILYIGSPMMAIVLSVATLVCGIVVASVNKRSRAKGTIIRLSIISFILSCALAVNYTHLLNYFE